MTKTEETCGIVTKESGRIRVRFKNSKHDPKPQEEWGEFWPVQLKMEWFGVYNSDKEETVGVLVKENGRVRVRLKNTVQYTELGDYDGGFEEQMDIVQNWFCGLYQEKHNEVVRVNRELDAKTEQIKHLCGN